MEFISWHRLLAKSFIALHLRYLDSLCTIENVPDSEDDADDHEGDQGGVAQVFGVHLVVMAVKESVTSAIE